MVLSSMRNPKEEQGVVFNHTPDSREDAAIRRAHDLPFGASSNSLLAVAGTLAESHAFWWCSLVPSVGDGIKALGPHYLGLFLIGCRYGTPDLWREDMVNQLSAGNS